MGGFNRPALKALPQYGEDWLTGNHAEEEEEEQPQKCSFTLPWLICASGCLRVVVWHLQCENVCVCACEASCRTHWHIFAAKLCRPGLFGMLLFFCFVFFFFFFCSFALSHTLLWAFSCAFSAGSPRVKLQLTSSRISLSHMLWPVLSAGSDWMGLEMTFLPLLWWLQLDIVYLVSR